MSAGLSNAGLSSAGLSSAGDAAAGTAIACAFARAGADVVLLHQPEDEDAALEVAGRIEALGRHCELFAGDINEQDFCQEGAFQAAFQGSGTIDVVVNVARHLPGGIVTSPDKVGYESPREALRRDLPGLRAVALAAAPHFTSESHLIHIQCAPGWGGLEAARRLAAIAGWARRELRDLPVEDQAKVHCLAGSPEDTARRAVALAGLTMGALTAG